MIPAWATPGRKVVCIDAEEDCKPVPGLEWIGTLDGLTKGTIYTLRAVGRDPTFLDPTVKLVEIVRDHDSDGETGYQLRRFRPIITIEEDMLTFRSMINTVPTEPKETTDA